MKTGILTFHKSINYGSVLQTFALVSTLQSMGHTVEVIDYEPQKYHQIYDLYHKNNSIRNILSNLIRRFPARKAFRHQQLRFLAFAEKYLPLSEEAYFFNSDITSLDKKYDAIICGGDQIWNVHATDCDDIYFLPTTKECKKIAYAISVNNTNFTEPRCTDALRQWILDFDAISLRESSGCKKLEAFLGTGTEIVTAMDPAFLLQKEDYRVIADERLVKEPYIFLFSVTFSADVVRAATLFSQKTGLPVYAMLSNSKSYKYLKKQSPIHILPDHLSPEDFLRYVSHAELVLSNSFHGTAFSIIYEKNFFAINDTKADGSLKNDQRLTHILQELGLSHRLITADQVVTSDSIAGINYPDVRTRKASLVAKSLEYLNDALNAKENP